MDDRLPDVLLAEFSTLRDEIAAHESEKSRNLALTLTATAAIGTFALGTDRNREVLLVLPLVLAGLAISFTKHSLDIDILGQYLRECWWPNARTVIDGFNLPTAKSENGQFTILGWEDWIQDRRAKAGRLTPYGSLGWLPPALIFAAPALGALILTWPASRPSAWAAMWVLDTAAVLSWLGFSIWVGAKGPGWK